MSEISISAIDPQRRHDAAGLVRDAFWDLYRPGCVEHLILDLAHAAPEYRSGLELVAELDDDLVGIGLATVATVIGVDGVDSHGDYFGYEDDEPNEALHNAAAIAAGKPYLVTK